MSPNRKKQTLFLYLFSLLIISSMLIGGCSDSNQSASSESPVKQEEKSNSELNEVSDKEPDTGAYFSKAGPLKDIIVGDSQIFSAVIKPRVYLKTFVDILDRATTVEKRINQDSPSTSVELRYTNGKKIPLTFYDTDGYFEHPLANRWYKLGEDDFSLVKDMIHDIEKSYQVVTGTFLSADWGDYFHLELQGDDGLAYSFFVWGDADRNVNLEQLAPGTRLKVVWQNIDQYMDPPKEVINMNITVNIELLK